MGLLSLIYLILEGRSLTRRQKIAAETASETMPRKISHGCFAPAPFQAELLPARLRRSEKDRRI
jgi:hypothetical protein